ncbi:cellulose synthase catalytic subunit [Cocleimonas sp. KMM 6892]|uniref:cellulose synthase catalytic subunit n=1 Tax=unclassified Cocleimonas TaxID=2639732 RepID=UPI002DBFCD79|nr:MULTISPECIES: cellulose synthase catalytic subunit [unclassified Cocleimonas]MEB8432175.1 cellulose synthase catalytic subunit [Cocleimonas sp. KMM 6892]MEC4714739.1 cellulose synthase catalytic subunit [Cocleimonas sp. KMM 6895]MEC4744447.1 cellulose synthase catalytic subunit [Cocleimonas sp. KMM 6896]
MNFYFDKYEDRKPEPPLPHNEWRELLWQYFAVIALVVGAWYITWRWTSSLNYDALWYAIPLVIAETGAYIGLILFTFNLWKVKDTPKQDPPTMLSEVIAYDISKDRKINVDMYFPTYDEDPELVRLSLIDAKNVLNPMGVNISIHVLDDGSRDSMKQVADEEGVNYITREGNIGFKAGNLRNAMEQTGGDFIVICDADTRPLPTLLEHTLGYFKDSDVAWVQTPQWFFDIPEGKPLDQALGKYLSTPGSLLGKGIQKIIGPVQIGQDPFVNDPKMFYDVIQRRRNWCNASFCCGAGSIHRREAVMEAALKSYAEQIDADVEDIYKKVKKITGESKLDESLLTLIDQQALLNNEFTPYRFHVSEDIYTSIVLHSDPDRNWKSVMHPDVESKMLSPQDLLTWTIQRFKYAGGTLDIAKNDNPVFRKGMSLPQRLMYATTIWSYIGGIWNAIFLTAPLVYLFFAVSPVQSYSMDFYIHIVPFLLLTEIAFMIGGWGLAGYPSKASYLAFFPTNLRALWTVMKGEKISFPVTPKDRQEGSFLHLAIPQTVIIVLTTIGIIYAWSQYQLEHPSYDINGVLLNTFWGLNNILALSGIIFAALWKPEQEQEEITAV